MTKKNITLDELAAMIAGEFDKIHDDMATKGDLRDLRNEVTERLDRIDKRLDAIERRLDHIEDVVLKDHLQRIQTIEHAIGLRKIAA